MFKGMKYTCFLLFRMVVTYYISTTVTKPIKITLTHFQELKNKILGESIIFIYCIEFLNRLTFPEIPLENIIGKVKIT